VNGNAAACGSQTWFVLERNKLFLLPVTGSDTEWFKNVLKNLKFRIKAGSVEEEFEANPTTDPEVFSSTVKKIQQGTRSERGEEILREIRRGCGCRHGKGARHR
jgi:hypothetical protein